MVNPSFCWGVIDGLEIAREGKGQLLVNAIYMAKNDELFQVVENSMQQCCWGNTTVPGWQ